MLPSFESAFCVYGPVQKVAAHDCGVTDRTFYRWATGRTPCPKYKRQSVDRALGAKVDWVQYDVELKACKRGPEATEPPKAAGWVQTPSEPPKAPPQQPQSAPSGQAWGFD